MRNAHSTHSPARPPATAGFTLMESIVTVAIAAVILTVFTSTISASYLLRKSTHVIQAGNFLREEIDSLRTLPYAELLNRTNGNFLGLSLTRGPWKVKTVSSPPSGTNVLAMETAQTALVNETGLAILPGNYHADLDMTAKFDVLSNSPAGWGAGLVFDYRDAENHYRYRYSSGGLALDKVVHGTVTTLWSQSATYATGTWYTLEVVTSGSSIALKKNGVTLATVTDATFTTGDAGLQTLSSALIYVDDVSIAENGVTTSWNFDSDATGAMPLDWQRFVYFDLPSGTGTLTISDYLGATGIKNVTASVTWNENGVSKSVSGSSLIAQ